MQQGDRTTQSVNVRLGWRAVIADHTASGHCATSVWAGRFAPLDPRQCESSRPGGPLDIMDEDPDSTVRSELRSIGRTMDDHPNGEEAKAQRRQRRQPWVTLLIGLLLVAAFIGALMVLGPQVLRH